ncbi:MAG: hypothetical protein ACI4I1_08955 [Oscillospiraceae bacterium]
MDRFTDEQVYKILCMASRRKVLILTLRDKTAIGLRDSILDYIYRHGIGSAVSRYQSARGCIYFNGGFETIRIMSVGWWNSHAGCDLYVYDGLVFVTNSSITDIKHIKEQPRPVTEIWNTD